MIGEEGENVAIPRPFTRAVIVQLLDVALRPLGGRNNTVMTAIETVSISYFYTTQCKGEIEFVMY